MRSGCGILPWISIPSGLRWLACGSNNATVEHTSSTLRSLRALCWAIFLSGQFWKRSHIAAPKRYIPSGNQTRLAWKWTMEKVIFLSRKLHSVPGFFTAWDQGPSLPVGLLVYCDGTIWAKKNIGFLKTMNLCWNPMFFFLCISSWFQWFSWLDP